MTERRPRVASVLGEQGYGKTRLAARLTGLVRAALPQAEIVELYAREPLGNDADELLAGLLRRALELPLVAPSDGGRELLRQRLGGGEGGGESVTAAALLLRWISPEDAAVQSLRAAPGALRANLARAGMASLCRLAARGPVVVLLDDAHWADDTLLDALEQATVSELPLWICAFGRPGFGQSRPGWGQRAAHVHRLSLGALDEVSAAALCRHLLEPATNVPEPIIQRLIERTQGVPLYIWELMRGLRRDGLVREQAGGVWSVASEVLDRMSDSPLFEWLARRGAGLAAAGAGRPGPAAGADGTRVHDRGGGWCAAGDAARAGGRVPPGRRSGPGTLAPDATAGAAWSRSSRLRDRGDARYRRQPGAPGAGPEHPSGGAGPLPPVLTAGAGAPAPPGVARRRGR